jgi:DNA-dependent RNA polymerase auxiliary subunit epsilon
MEREEIDREFIKSLNDKILKLEKNKKSFKKLSPLIQRLII